MVRTLQQLIVRATKTAARRSRARAGNSWGMLRANHFVNSHEQGLRTLVTRAEPTVNSWRRDLPEQGADTNASL